MIIIQAIKLKLILNFHIELHDKNKEYPPTPETLTPELEWLSYYQKESGTKNRYY